MIVIKAGEPLMQRAGGLLLASASIARMPTVVNRRARRTCLHLVVALAAVGLLGLGGCTSSSGAASTPHPPSAGPPAPAGPSVELTTPYESPDGYSISAPAGWVLHPTDGQNGLSVLFAAQTKDAAAQKPFVDNINVVITPVMAESLDAIVERTKQQSPAVLPNYSLVDVRPIDVDGHDGRLLTATYDHEGAAGQLQNLQLIAVNGTKQYTVTFTSAAGSFGNLQVLAKSSLSSLVLN